MTHRNARGALALSLTAALLAGGGLLAPAAHATAPPDRKGSEATRTALRDLVGKGGLPGVAATVRDRNGSWSATYGHADTATGRGRSTDEHFRGASITKTFVATVLLQLEAEGRLDLDDTVERWLPGLVRGNGYDGNRITLRQLLDHTSGIANHTDDPEFIHDAAGPGFPEHRFDSHTPEELVAIALTYPPGKDPLRAPKYSNTNFTIAGMVIEKVTGRSYAQEIRRRIVVPLGLRGTSFPGSSPKMPAPHPVGYSRLHQKAPDAEIHDATEQNMTWLGAGGDVITTLDDLDRFQGALLGGRLLPPAQRAELLREVPAEDGIGFGLGVEFAVLSCGVKIVGKTGRTNGSLSGMASTTDGRHRLTFNINGDWLQDGALYVNVVEAEFCGAPAGRPAQGTRPGP
ncbi:serine hydrolase domain-containing protein [Streptomyces sp. NPDC093224]|uniref:serine hydrolase domain-containing protein n=1 Tax=Streptomyces sp. NPDC093224 TaxID=3155198 RepID=UPI00343DE3A2